MSDNPIKFPSSPSSSEDEFPSHHSSKENISSDDRMSSDYSPLWSSKKEEPEEEDEEDEDDADADADDSNSEFDSPPPKRARQA